MRIRVYAVVKEKKDHFSPAADHFKKLCSKYASLKEVNVFTKAIEKAQRAGREQARKAYGEALPLPAGELNVALTEEGATLDSMGFAKLLESSGGAVNFFIGGAYGFDEEFLSKADKKVSLSPMTFGHGLAKVMLLEQIYRGLALNAGHPYHKE